MKEMNEFPNTEVLQGFLHCKVYIQGPFNFQVVVPNWNSVVKKI